jgi:DNA-binding transcriptional regulator/RsmH inhibitor MraZ
MKYENYDKVVDLISKIKHIEEKLLVIENEHKDLNELRKEILKNAKVIESDWGNLILIKHPLMKKL